MTNRNWADSFKLHLRVGDQIGLAIMRGEFAPGSILPTEAQFCQTLGVSRTAVREAVRGLIAKGLVEARSKLGTRVRAPEDWNQMDPDVLKWRIQLADTSTYLEKMFQLRNAVEPAAAENAAMYAREVDHDRLSEAFGLMEAAGDDNAAWVEADLAFHKCIYIATRNEFFWPIGQLFEIGLREMFSIAALGQHRPRALEEHRDLRDAILRKDPAAAREAAQVMLGNARTDIDIIREPTGTKPKRSADRAGE
ncbi:FadR/GntR family transcriptional regulator [Oceaniglobus indicus]|uniref:FadR/GntR family transcriptional regulator n=1 Tax=Oceaniglobus indicus TaxID=2047749 RepID=UPI000C1A410C|nr:FadR/GntR family transcriptional regulator [Oceaniglobus indicus]